MEISEFIVKNQSYIFITIIICICLLLLLYIYIYYYLPYKSKKRNTSNNKSNDYRSYDPYSPDPSIRSRVNQRQEYVTNHQERNVNTQVLSDINNKASQILRKSDEILNNLKKADQKTNDELLLLKENNKNLINDNNKLIQERDSLKQEKESLRCKLEAFKAENTDLQQRFETVNQNINKLLPDIFKSNEDLFNEVKKLCGQLDNPFARKLLASISLLNQKTAFDSTEEIYYLIGAALSSYLRECEKLNEEDICRKMQMFAAALRTETVFISVPRLGENYQVDQVRFKNGGSRISKILSWCINNGSGVFRRAEVE